MSAAKNAIFLSYAKQDAQAAASICDALRAQGIEVWFDQSELRGGDAWDSAIRRQIKTCGLLIPVISVNTQSRAEGYFRLEWKLAVDRSHLISQDRAFLVPVVIDTTSESDARVPDKFREVQWTHLPGGETTPAFVARIARLLDQETDAAAGAAGGRRDTGGDRRCSPACHTVRGTGVRTADTTTSLVAGDCRGAAAVSWRRGLGHAP